jgi:hypothetical protein
MTEEDKQPETMPQWQPPATTPHTTEDDLAELLGPAAATTPPPGQSQGRFVLSQGDALLLNAMDHHRSSAEQWMEILQRPAGGTAHGDDEEEGNWLDGDSGMAENYGFVGEGGGTGGLGMGDDDGLALDVDVDVLAWDGGPASVTWR